MVPQPACFVLKRKRGVGSGEDSNSASGKGGRGPAHSSPGESRVRGRRGKGQSACRAPPVAVEGPITAVCTAQGREVLVLWPLLSDWT